jgi:hypothetical protein
VVLRILDSMGAPAIVRNSRVDYVAANPLGRALYAPLFDSVEQPANSARFTFLDPAAQEFYVDWERVAKDLVAHLRSEAGRNPYDRGLSDLVGELELAYEVMDLSADDGLTVSVYSADPGSRSQEGLDLLASWTATPERSPTTVEEWDFTCRSLAAASTP